jgi:hypothetical protein
VGGLGAAVADFVAAGQDPVHGADRAVVAALVEQDGPCLGRRLVGEPVAVEKADDLPSFLVREGSRVRRPLALLLFRAGRAGILRAPQGGPRFPEETAGLRLGGDLDERREKPVFYFF